MGRVRRWAVWMALAWVVGASGAPAGGAAGRAGPPPLAGPAANDRVLVLAPHCDDEVLGAGGLIQQARAAGAQVQVVVLTNGDGFKAAARQLSGHAEPAPADYISLGRHRQEETRAALAILGLRPQQVHFLGYPDGGLVQLWEEHWALDHPYTSTATKLNHSPYADSFRHRAPYAGRAVLDDLEAIFRRFRPTLVVLPHPGDRHSDHWVTYGFGSAAVYELGLRSRVRILCYLIHRTGWSEPPTRDGKPLLPPDRTEAWRVLTLTPGQVEVKTRAVECYQSQLKLLGPVMREFVGTTELFASSPWKTLEVLPASADKGVGYLHRRELPPEIVATPEEATLPSGRIEWVRVAVQGGQLRLLLRLSQPVGTGESCWVYLHPLTPAGVARPRSYLLAPQARRSGVAVKTEGRLLDAALPWEREAVGVILAVEVRGPDRPPARTQWVVLTRP